MIIPTDEHSPGARAAKVAAYLDSRLPEWEERDQWREGLKLVEQLSQQAHGKPFLQSAPDERTAGIDSDGAERRKTAKAGRVFFAELKAKVVHAYYTSEIGIKQEMEDKGNSYLAEFAGTDVS